MTDIKEFLRGFNRELCDGFKEEFPGTPDNVGNLVERVNKGKDTLQFVWTNAVLSACGSRECVYCE